MRTKNILVLATLFASSLLFAGSTVDGTWKTTGTRELPVTMQLRSSGATLTGTVRLNDQVTVDILDGQVVADRVTFRAMIPEENDSYPMIFSGRRSGETIHFKCDVEVNPPDERTTLGPACVHDITVRRVGK
jgi:hypothetical protein